MAGYEGNRARVDCPVCGQSVILRTHTRSGDRKLRIPLVGQHRVPGPGRPTTRAVCAGAGTDAPPC